MRRAGKVVARIHSELREAAVPGVTMLELDRMAARIIAERDCTPNFLNYHGFPAHVCLSPNEVIVHGIPDERRVADGDIISLDAGAIYKGWHGDAALTFAIGEIPAEVQALLDATEQALWAGIEHPCPGHAWVTSATPSRPWPSRPVSGWCVSTRGTASDARCTRNRRCSTTANRAAA